MSGYTKCKEILLFGSCFAMLATRIAMVLNTEWAEAQEPDNPEDQVGVIMDGKANAAEN